VPLGYILALITSVFFSLYIVPRKLSKASPTVYTLFVGVGFCAFSLISYLITGLWSGKFESFDNPALVFACLNGAFWAIGFILFTKAIDKIGLSRSNQWKNFQGPIGAILCLVFLSEYAQTNLGYVLSAIVAIFISAMLFTIKKDETQETRKQGVLFAVFSAFFFGTNAMLQKYVVMSGAGIQAQQVCISSFVFITMAVFILFKDKTLAPLKNAFAKDNLYGVLAGTLYFFASLFMIHSNRLIPASIAFTIIQFNAVWTVLIGVLYFKEIDFKKHWARILGGIVLAILGVVLLLFAQR